MLRDINSKRGDGRESIFQLHHEDTVAFEKTFRLETLAAADVFKSIGNSLLEIESSLIHITTKHMLDDEASNSVGTVKQIRREPYNTFLKNSLHNASASVYDNMQTNNLPLRIQKNSIASSKSKQQLVIIKSDRKTYESVYIVC